MVLHTHSLSLRQIVFLPSLTFFTIFPIPSYLLVFPLIQVHSLLLSLQLSCHQLNFQGYFPLLYRFPSFPYLEILTFEGVCTIKLSHMHSIRQRLSENPLINAEVKIFNLLACSGSLLEVLSTFWKSDMDYLCLYCLSSIPYIPH